MVILGSNQFLSWNLTEDNENYSAVVQCVQDYFEGIGLKKILWLVKQDKARSTP